MLGDSLSGASPGGACRVVLLLLVGCGGAAETVADAGRDASPLMDAAATDTFDAGADTAADAPQSTPEATVDAAVDDAAAVRRIVFLTSVSYAADLGGLAGADAKCQALATSAGLPGVFKAWLSDATTAARDRLTHATVPYQRVDGMVVARDWSELTSGVMLENPIFVTETGGGPPAQPRANCYPTTWTDTDPYGGIENGGDCQGWTSTADAGAGTWLGASGSTYPTWSAGCFDNGACAFTAPLYCLEQ